MKTQKAIIMLATAVALLLPGTLLADSITFTLTSPVQTGTPGATLVFTGTLTNPNAIAEFLNGDSASALPTSLQVDDTPFFLNAPVSLDAGASTGPIELFDVMIDPAATPGTYDLNFFNIVGGPLSDSPDLLATREFTVTVAASSPVPEPGTWLLLGSAMIGWLRTRPRRKDRFDLLNGNPGSEQAAEKMR